MRRTLFLLLALSFAAAAQDVVVTISNPVSPGKWEPNITACDSQSADSVTITCEEPLDLSQEKGGALEIIGARDSSWEEDVIVGSVTADIELHSGATQVHVRGAENMAMKEDADIDVRITSNGMPYNCGSTAAYLFDDEAGDIKWHSAALSLAYARLTPYENDHVATVVGSPYPFFGTWVDSLSIDAIGLNLRSVDMNEKPVTPLIIEDDVKIGELNIGSIDISLERGDYATVYADGRFNADAIDDLSLGGSTLTLTHQAHVGTLTATALESAEVVLNGGSIAASDITIAHADIIGGVNKLTPAVETLTINGNVILRDKVTVNHSYEIAEGSHINAIGMGTENGYAHVEAGTAYQLIAGKGTEGDISGATASYGDIQGKLETRGDGVYVTFDGTETGNVYYVLSDTDAEVVANDMRPDAQHMALLAELEMNTSLSVTDITVTDAGAMVFKGEIFKGENPTCKLDTQLTLEDGAQLVFDFTPSKLDANTPMLTYTGGSINHSGTTLITLMVGENWEQGCTDVYELATGLGSLGNVHINVSPADRDTVTYLGAAYIHNGTLYYGNIPEPATATLSLLALAGLAARRRRH